MESWANRSRWWIVTGYALLLIGNLVTVVGQFSAIVHSEISWTLIVDYVVGPLAALGSLWAWWWFTQLEIRTDEQRRIVRIGVVGLVIALASQCTLYVTSFASIVSNPGIVAWVLVSWSVTAVGDLVAALGFLSAIMALREPLSATAQEQDA